MILLVLPLLVVGSLAVLVSGTRPILRMENRIDQGKERSLLVFHSQKARLQRFFDEYEISLLPSLFLVLLGRLELRDLGFSVHFRR